MTTSDTNALGADAQGIGPLKDGRFPTPYRVENNSLWIVADSVPYGPAHILDVRGWGYLTGGGQALGLNGDDAFEVQRRTAAFIVRACNAHYDLVEALREAEAKIITLYAAATPHGNRDGRNAFAEQDETVLKIRAALSQATKEDGRD